ncbi:MAG: replication initiator protein A [Alphaproteobacteria bacterium]|nr:replication initiator protein A [Alphaproteobacteria bacterium]
MTEVDLFLDHLVDAPFRDERSLMDFPFFSLQKRPRMEPMIFDDGRVTVAIDPSPKGIATIWDKDLLIYVASLLSDRLEKGLPVSPTVRFAAHDYLVQTGRSVSSRGYDLLLNSLYRLRNTSILTNIKAGGETETKNFGWIADWRVIERVGSRGVRRMAGVEVTLTRWMFAAIVRDRRVLTISKEYFTLDQGIERRLYELARRNCTKGTGWTAALPLLAERCGSARELRKFKAELRKIAERGGVLGFSVSLEDGPAGVEVTLRDGPAVRPAIESAHEIALASPRSCVRLEPTVRAYERARAFAPGYDLKLIERRWREWNESKGTVPNDPDAAFLGYVKSYVRLNPL